MTPLGMVIVAVGIATIIAAVLIVALMRGHNAPPPPLPPLAGPDAAPADIAEDADTAPVIRTVTPAFVEPWADDDVTPDERSPMPARYSRAQWAALVGENGAKL
jgi:hypothetical protein